MLGDPWDILVHCKFDIIMLSRVEDKLLKDYLSRCRWNVFVCHYFLDNFCYHFYFKLATILSLLTTFLWLGFVKEKMFTKCLCSFRPNVQVFGCYYMYYKISEYWDRYVSANSADPDKTAPTGVV